MGRRGWVPVAAVAVMMAGSSVGWSGSAAASAPTTSPAASPSPAPTGPTATAALTTATTAPTTTTATTAPTTTAAPTAPATAASPSFSGHGSIDQAYLLGGVPGTTAVLVNAFGHPVGSGTIDAQGSLIVRNVPPGPGYAFRTTAGTTVTSTPRFHVLSPDDTSPESFYSDQHLNVGLNYITMRDGVSLAATVRLPPGKTLADGPFPTVIEESGYAIASPHSLIDAELHLNGESTSDPLVPDSATVVGSLVAPLLGFATVSLQMRGTGCSGGAFDLFDLPTTYDGYDAVQIAAAQPWVANHKVGMVGISFSGISQMFVAGTRPPGLAAIAPMSLTDDLYSTGFPGGMFNSGFAGSWLAERQTDAEVAPAGGLEYAKVLIQQGDTQCLANQALHGQAQNIQTLLSQASHYVPSLYSQRSPSTWARLADVPVFVSGAFQDEQTGGQWPATIKDLSHDPRVWTTITNGTHIDSLGPGTITRWLEFLDLYVADKVPTASPTLTSLAPALYSEVVGAPSGPVAPVGYTDEPTLAAARAAFEQQARVRVLFDNGGGSAGPGAMQPVWSQDYTSWPPPHAVPTSLRLGPGGSLTPAPTGGTRPAATAGTVSFRPDPSARPVDDLPTGNVWAALPPYQWVPASGTDGVGFISAPLIADVVAVGPASLNLWVESTAADTDLQATISEVRPNGQELFVQTGELRASDRALNRWASTATDPVPTYAAATASPLPAGRFTEVRIPIEPLAYAFRTGSRIRVSITAPGGDRPAWQFATYPTGGTVTDTIGLGGWHSSALVLSVVPGVTPPDAPPACPSLRGQPCRTYVAAANGG